MTTTLVEIQVVSNLRPGSTSRSVWVNPAEVVSLELVRGGNIVMTLSSGGSLVVQKGCEHPRDLAEYLGLTTAEESGRTVTNRATRARKEQ